MKRRNFVKKGALAAGVSTIVTGSAMANTAKKKKKKKENGF